MLMSDTTVTGNTNYNNLSPNTEVDAVQAWWNRLQSRIGIFPQMLRLPNVSTLGRRELHWLQESLLKAYEAVENEWAPSFAHGARTCLLTAMADLMASLAEALNGNHDMANAYLKSANIEASFIVDELNALNIKHDWQVTT
ncbi:MAG: hypothetical protein D6712_13920 [Chloroflexi bacterium]|nr:MAG: hypothetical protein D6712_13920 [Chloroflexota bacterium]